MNELKGKNMNDYKNSLWLAELIKTELKKEMQWFKEHKSDVGISIGFQDFVLNTVDRVLEECKKSADKNDE